jgi:hypothetical protein
MRALDSTHMPWEATAILLGVAILIGVVLFLPLRWLALRTSRPEAKRRIGTKELFAAGAVVTILVSLLWLKQAGSTYAAIALVFITGALYIGAYIVLDRQQRRDKGQKRSTQEPLSSK